MHPNDRHDHDWLYPSESNTDMCPIANAPFPGVYRVEAAGETVVPFDTLLEATREPPRDPEAEVRGKGGCLAQSSRDYVGWIFTRIGAARIEREVHAGNARVA